MASASEVLSYALLLRERFLLPVSFGEVTRSDRSPPSSRLAAIVGATWRVDLQGAVSSATARYAKLHACRAGVGPSTSSKPFSFPPPPPPTDTASSPDRLQLVRMSY